MYIYNARIITMAGPVIENGYIRVDNGVITDIGAGVPHMDDSLLEANWNTISDVDAEGRTVTPGLIDAHTHLGISADGAGAEGDDFNEDSDPVTPQLRVIDAIDPQQSYFEEALYAGITAVAVSPGSTNPIGGRIAVIKTFGDRIDDMLISEAGVKFSLGENPKNAFSDKDSAPVTRMATAAVIREALIKARRYLAEVEAAEDSQNNLPEYDMKSEALIPVLKRTAKAYFHCHKINDAFTAIRIAKEFGLDYVLIHCTEGHLHPELLGAEKASVVCGPIICDRCKAELRNFTPANAGSLAKNGVKVAICTDHSEVPIQYLPLSAAICVRHDMDYYDALAAITINAAEMLGIAERKGSLAVGKDADLVIWCGDPLNVLSKPEAVMIEGEFRT